MLKAKIESTLICAILVIMDVVVKIWAVNVLPSGRIVVIPGLFNLTYVENRGMAFGLLYGHSNILAIVTGLLMAGMLAYIWFGKHNDKWLIRLIMLVIAGGLGNLIDRITRGFVVDYLDFSAIFGFPVFNLADCCVVVGCIAMLIYVFIMERKQMKANQESDI